ANGISIFGKSITLTGATTFVSGLNSTAQGYANTAQSNAISTASGDATTKANNALSSAQAYTRAQILADNQIIDTRTTNQTPSWYYTNHSKQKVREFKNFTAVGTPSGASGTYGIMETDVPWSDSSGGNVVQVITCNNGTWQRSGNASTWTSWTRRTDDTKNIGILAYDNAVTLARLDSTIIDGGYIKTNLINAKSIMIGDLGNNDYTNLWSNPKFTSAVSIVTTRCTADRPTIASSPEGSTNALRLIAQSGGGDCYGYINNVTTVTSGYNYTFAFWVRFDNINDSNLAPSNGVYVRQNGTNNHFTSVNLSANTFVNTQGKCFIVDWEATFTGAIDLRFGANIPTNFMLYVDTLIVALNRWKDKKVGTPNMLTSIGQGKTSLADLDTTLIQGGKIRTNLINADTLIARQIKTSENSDRISVNENGDNSIIIRHANGKKGIEIGLVGGEPKLVFYDTNESKTWEGGTAGLVYVTNVPESWSTVNMHLVQSITSQGQALNQSSGKNYMLSRVQKVSGQWRTTSGTNHYLYNQGINASSELNKQYAGYHSTQSKQTTNWSANGWYCIGNQGLMARMDTNDSLVRMFKLWNGQIEGTTEMLNLGNLDNGI